MSRIASPAVLPAASFAPVAGRPWCGVLLLVVALLFFASMDVITKFLAADYSVPLIMAVRYGVNCLLMVLLLGPSQGRRLVATRRTGLVLVRSVSLAVGSLLVGLALQRMPVAETTAIIYLAPLLVLLLAGAVLGERVGLLGWLAGVGGLAGVLLIARPGSGLDSLGVLFILGAVVTTAVYHLLSRVLARTEQTLALLFWTTLVGTAAFGAMLPWSWPGAWGGSGGASNAGAVPDALQLTLLLGLGVMGGLGHFCLTAAFREAPASLLAPINYLQLLWAGLLGYLVFAHVPDQLTLVGMAVIALSGMVSAVRAGR